MRSYRIVVTIAAEVADAEASAKGAARAAAAIATMITTLTIARVRVVEAAAAADEGRSRWIATGL